jgi:hypothetical protein
MMLTLTKKTYEDLQTIEVYKEGLFVGQRAKLNFLNFTDISDDPANQRINFNFGSFRIEDRFGDGSDGDLIISTGTFTLDFQNQNFLIRQYRNLSITGNATLSFTNPHNNGSVAIIYVADTATITSSAVAIDLSGMGARGGIGASANGFDTFQIGWNGFYRATAGTGGTTSAPTGGTGIESFVNNNLGFRFLKKYVLSVGSGGGAGAASSGATQGNGGRGGGGIILFARKLNFNSTIYANGLNGGNASVSSGPFYAGGGGGGGGGFVVIYAQQIMNLTGTIQARGGNGGNGAQGDNTTVLPWYYGGGGGACAGNAGQNGLSIIPSGFSLTTNVLAGSNGASTNRGIGGGGGGGGYILIATI